MPCVGASCGGLGSEEEPAAKEPGGDSSEGGGQAEAGKDRQASSHQQNTGRGQSSKPQTDERKRMNALCMKRNRLREKAVKMGQDFAITPEMSSGRRCHSLLICQDTIWGHVLSL